MDFANTQRRLSWLWEHRHTHDGDTFQEQITVIRQQVEQEADGPGRGTGAHVHLLMTTPQSIDPGGETIQWTHENPVHGRYEFAALEFPTDEVVIPKLDYYDVHVTCGWSSFTGGGTVEVVRTRDGAETVLWPPASAPGTWESTAAAEFEGVAGKMPLLAGDVITVKVDHGDGSAQTLEYATLVVGAVDRTELRSWELIFEADNYGVTWDDSSWWTTDNTDDVDPALFERDLDGTVLNSYTGYDGLEITRNRGLVFAVGFLWGVGHEETVSKVDPADGIEDSEFVTEGNSPGDGQDSRTGIGYDGTNLFVVERVTHSRVEEYNTAGVHQGNHAFPANYSLVDVTWDGVHWWATTTTTEIIRLDASFVMEKGILGPPGENRGCHYRDGYLYVMTPTGLYRKAV